MLLCKCTLQWEFVVVFNRCNYTGSWFVEDNMIIATCNFRTWKIATLLVLFYILFLFSLSLSGTACDIKHTNEPLHGHHCVARAHSEITVSQKDCMTQCFRKKMCYFINHDYGTDQCHLGLDKCESLVPVIQGTVQVFGPPRYNCVHWGPRGESGRERIEVLFNGCFLYLARVLIGDALIVGKFKPHYGNFQSNKKNMDVGRIKETDHDIEFLIMDPACTLLWMPYRAGELLPNGVISGGHLADESTTYVAKVIHDIEPSFGYYNTKSELAYYKMGDLSTTSTMELLIPL